MHHLMKAVFRVLPLALIVFIGLTLLVDGAAMHTRHSDDGSPQQMGRHRQKDKNSPRDMDRWAWERDAELFGQHNAITLTPAQMRDFRLQVIKASILDKLGMIQRPFIGSNRMELPEPLRPAGYHSTANLTVEPGMQGDAPSWDDSEVIMAPIEIPKAKTEEVIIFGKEDVYATPRWNRSSKFFKLHMKDKLKNLKVTSATLWFHTTGAYPGGFGTANVSLTDVTWPNHPTGKVRERDLITKFSIARPGWKNISVTHVVKKWLKPKHSRHLHGVKVSCSGCGLSRTVIPISSEGENRPFLVVNTEENPRRTKRSVECNLNGCCKVSFTVDFAEIGWDDWIKQPSSYRADYCTGSCSGSGLQNLEGTTNRQHVMTQAIPGISACCAPTKYSSISMLYQTDDVFKLTEVPNMAVDTCGCNF